MLALGTRLENMGKTVTYYISTPISKIFLFLEKTNIIQSSFDYGKYDQIIFTDSANPVVMFEHLWMGHEEYFAAANTLCIDHHISNTGYAKKNIINPDVGSTCELLATLLEQRAPGSITPEIATYIYLGVSTDTGHFMHATTAETYKIAARLVELGADIHSITSHIYKSKSLETLAFTSKILSRSQKSGNLLRTRVEYDEITQAGIDREEAKEALYQLQGIQRDGIIAYFEIRKSE
jgi:bifunctional oligoribonuclease and PAP phosphatase NrnA